MQNFFTCVKEAVKVPVSRKKGWLLRLKNKPTDNIFKAKPLVSLFCLPVMLRSNNAINVAQWYVVQGSDTTMRPVAASLPGQ